MFVNCAHCYMIHSFLQLVAEKTQNKQTTQTNKQTDKKANSYWERHTYVLNCSSENLIFSVQPT